MTTRRERFLVGGVLVALILPLALAARWCWAAVPDGRQFRPRPDALEYAAAAQAIAQDGRYYLQVGPYRVRPRYPPGWPLLLALAVRLGVPGDDLWRVTGVCGAALACLLALLAAGAVCRLGHGEARRVLAGALAAGLVSGLGWALAPLCVAVGRVVLSDEPAALAAAVVLLATGFAFLGGQATGAKGLPAAILGGSTCGLLAAIRPVSAALLAPALLLLAAAGWRALGRGAALRRAAAWLGGAALVPLLIAALLWRSHLSPWQWSGYELWAPRWYADVQDTFKLRFALRGNESFTRGGDDRPIPNVWFFARVLLGLPGLDTGAYLGPYWPALGWLGGAWLAWRYRRRRRFLAGALAAVLAVAAHLLLYSLYFFPAARFMLVPLMFPLLSLAICCGLGVSAPHRKGAAVPRGGRKQPYCRWGVLGQPWPALRLGAGLAGSALIAGIIAVFLGFRTATAAVAGSADEDVRSAFTAWRRLPDEARAATVMPFDPVAAQALGLLPPATVEPIRSWGRLPPTVQVRRLRALGVIPGG